MLNFKLEEEYKIKLKKEKRKLLIFELIKLFIFISLIIVFIFAITNNLIILYIISGIIFVIELFLLLFNKIYDNYEDYKKILEVYDIHKKRRKLETKLFFNDGKEFLNNKNPKASDLDLFGSNSLYQYLSSAKTKYGKELLKDTLLTKQEENIEYRESVYELANNEDTLMIEAKINYFNNKNNIVNLDEFNSVNNHKIKINILYFIPLLSFLLFVSSIILASLKIIDIYYVFIFLISNILFSKLCLRNNIFKLNAKIYLNSCKYYIGLINKLKNINYKTKYINDLKNNIIKEESNIKSIYRIYNVLEYRLNALFNILTNALFILDFFTIIVFNHRTKSAKSTNDLLKDVAKLEVMISLANVGIDNEIYSIPTDNQYIVAKNMYHPLIKNPVSNDISMDKGIIITGSNMSGKTTFLRTVGINLTLKNANGLVFASEFMAPTINIYTSLRTIDDLSQNISSFQAEIVKLQIINEAIKNERALILIDEVFKGTNTKERIEAAKLLINKLNDYNQLFLITTHDEEICDNKNIINYHFEEYYINDEIHFDYKIKEGISKTKNATYLLKMANII